MAGQPAGWPPLAQLTSTPDLPSISKLEKHQENLGSWQSSSPGLQGRWECAEPAPATPSPAPLGLGSSGACTLPTHP